MSSKQFALVEGGSFFWSLNYFVCFGYHFPNLREFLLSVGWLDLSFRWFFMSGRLKCIGIDNSVLSVGEGVVIKGTIIRGDIRLGLHDLASDLLHLPFQREFVFSLFLRFSHHFINCFISLLLQHLILFL